MSVIGVALRLFMANDIFPWARDVSLLVPRQDRLLISFFLTQEFVLDQFLLFPVSRMEKVGVVTVVCEDNI